MKGFIGMGSNLGDRRRHLRAALVAMQAAGIEPTRISSVWETEPIDVDGGSWFLNMVAEVEVPHDDPFRLLGELQEIERSGGRRRGVRNAPRSLDLDILLIDGVTSDDPRLAIPHPRMWQRRFVLEPLAELVSDLDDARDRIRETSLVFRRGRLGILRAVGTGARAPGSSAPGPR